MGEMADYYLELEDYFQDRLDYLQSIQAGNYVEEFNDPEDFDCAPPALNLICKFCNRENLHWELRNDKWRMCDDQGIHKCPINPLKEKINEPNN